mgnify:CR=1 FL=1
MGLVHFLRESNATSTRSTSGRSCRVVAAELNSLRQRQLTRRNSSCSSGAACSSSSNRCRSRGRRRFLFAAERAADFRAARAGIHVGNAAIASDRAHEFLRFAHVVGEDR